MDKIKNMLSQNVFINHLFFSIPLICLLMIEFAARGNFISIITWFVKAPIQFIVSLLLLYSIYILLWAITNKMGVTAILYSALWIIISSIAGCKREILGSPLMPWDFQISSNVAGLIRNVHLSQFKFIFNWIFITFFVILIAAIITIMILQKSKRLNKQSRIISSLLCCVAIVVMVLISPKANLDKSPSNICEKNGYVRGIISCTRLWLEMDDASVAASSSNLQYEFTTRKATTDNKPNIIFIMSEAFWDATLLPNVSYSEDPIPNFHKVVKECISGEMVSPTYGGLTSNVEFEIMTGFSLKYLPYQTNAYMTSVKKPIPSIPSYCKSIGYHTIAVHPYINTFFNRVGVYPMLGIDRFVSQSEMTDAKIEGAYISDDDFANYIIYEYEKSAKPVFMFNISIQNHWPYTTENYYKNNGFAVKGTKDLDKESMTALENYVQGIHDADKSLKKIIDYFKNVKQPTAIIFLGDHLPALTEQLKTYKQLGYIDESISDDELFKGDEGTNIENEKILVQNQKILKTPYLIWFNYKTGMEKGKTLSSNYLGVYAMSKIGLDIPPFYNFLLEYSNKLPVNRHFLSIVDQGIPYKKTPKIFSNYENIYQSIQNNILFGDQSKKNLFIIK